MAMMHRGNCFSYQCPGCGLVLYECVCDSSDKPRVFNPLQRGGMCDAGEAHEVCIPSQSLGMWMGSPAAGGGGGNVDTPMSDERLAEWEALAERWVTLRCGSLLARCGLTELTGEVRRLKRALQLSEASRGRPTTTYRFDEHPGITGPGLLADLGRD